MGIRSSLARFLQLGVDSVQIRAVVAGSIQVDVGITLPSNATKLDIASTESEVIDSGVTAFGRSFTAVYGRPSRIVKTPTRKMR